MTRMVQYYSGYDRAIVDDFKERGKFMPLIFEAATAIIGMQMFSVSVLVTLIVILTPVFSVIVKRVSGTR